MTIVDIYKICRVSLADMVLDIVEREKRHEDANELRTRSLILLTLLQQIGRKFSENVINEPFIQKALTLSTELLEGYLRNTLPDLTSALVVIGNNYSYTNIPIGSSDDFSSLNDLIFNLTDRVNNLDTTYLGLTDTPNSYVGQAKKLVAVDILGIGLEFIPQPITETQTSTVADVTVGAINAGDTVPSTLDIEELKNLIFNKTFFPDLNAPSFSLSNNAGLREIGELANFSSTFNFNRGSIVLQGITQNFRAGASSSHTINGVIQASNVLSLTNYPVVQGNNTITGTLTYGIGAQPLDSKGGVFSTPLIAGTSPIQSTSFEGVYPLFGSMVNITTSTKQALGSMISGNNIQINLVAETGGNKQFFEIPNAWLTVRPLQLIQYFNTVSNQFDTINKITDFTSSLTTKTIQGNIVNYTKYTYNGSDRATVLIRLIFA